MMLCDETRQGNQTDEDPPSAMVSEHGPPETDLVTDKVPTEGVNSATGFVLKPQVIYRCRKCRRIVASQDNLVSHKRGNGEESFKWRKRTGDPKDWEKDPAECSSIFIEPMKWMQAVEDGYVEEKLQCKGCNARLGSFNWAGMQCNCGAWVNPAFQLHKSRIDECHI